LNESDSEASGRTKNREEDDEGSVVSASSWNTNDIAEERADNSNKTKKMLIVCLIINVVLNLLQLSIYVACAATEENKRCELSGFGFGDLNQAHFTISCLLWAQYLSVILAYILIFIKMGKLFREAFPTNHREIRCKFGSIFLVYEGFLVSRAVCYY